MTGKPFEFEAADSMGYHGAAIWFINMLKAGNFENLMSYIMAHISDSGYPLYLSIIYYIFGSSIIAARIFKAIWGAVTCLLIYKYTKRNFGENIGRMAGIFCMLFPSLIYYCGLHVKEIEMTLLVVLFIERADYIMKAKHINFKNIFTVILLCLALFFFRTVLAAVAFFSIISAIIFTSNWLFGFSKKISITIWIIITFFCLFNSPIQNEISNYWDARTTNLEQSLEHRATEEQGNSFAKYASTPMYIPFMPIAPFPTLINIPWQQNHMYMAGGFFVKNVIGFFVITGILLLIQRKEILKHSLILFFSTAYLGILAVSKYAIVERFHVPIVPLLIVIAALGVSNLKMNKKYFVPFLVILVIIVISWNWIKLAGRI